MPIPHSHAPIQSTPRIADTDRTITFVSMCMYAGKSCHHPRAEKLSGGLHRFCNFHRMRANQFQRAYHKRRQMRRDRVRDYSFIDDLTNNVDTSPIAATRLTEQNEPTLPLEGTIWPILNGIEICSLDSSSWCHEDSHVFHEGADNPLFDLVLDDILRLS